MLFSFDGQGVFYFGGQGLRPRIMRGQNINGPAARLIVARARLMREREGTIAGYAVGADMDRPDLAFADDVLAIFGPKDKNLWTETIAVRLDGTYPDAYKGHLTGRGSGVAAPP